MQGKEDLEFIQKTRKIENQKIDLFIQNLLHLILIIQKQRMLLVLMKKKKKRMNGINVIKKNNNNKNYQLVLQLEY